MHLRTFPIFKLSLYAFTVVSVMQPCWSGVIASTFSNTPPGYVTNAYAISVTPFMFGTTISNQWAMQFTVPAGPSYVLTGIQVPLAFISGQATALFSIENDAGGKPGAVLDTFTFTGSSSTPAILIGVSALNPLLAGGGQYWLAAQMNPGIVATSKWFASASLLSGQALGPVASRSVPFPSSQWSVATNTQAAFEVDGNAVPEPSSLLLVTTAVLIAAARRCRQTSNPFRFSK